MGLIYVICLSMVLVIANGSGFVFLANNSIFKNHLVVSSDGANGSLGGLCDNDVCVFWLKWVQKWSREKRENLLLEFSRDKD